GCDGDDPEHEQEGVEADPEDQAVDDESAETTDESGVHDVGVWFAQVVFPLQRARSAHSPGRKATDSPGGTAAVIFPSSAAARARPGTSGFPSRRRRPRRPAG